MNAWNIVFVDSTGLNHIRPTINFAQKEYADVAIDALQKYDLARDLVRVPYFAVEVVVPNVTVLEK